MLPQPTDGASFFTDWLNLMNGRWRLLEQDIIIFLNPGTFLQHRRSFHGVFTVTKGYFVFSLFHPDFPAAVNYGGAGRFLADEILRGLYHEDAFDTNLLEIQNNRSESDSSNTPELSPNHVDSKALLASLAAYRLNLHDIQAAHPAKNLALPKTGCFS
ncbi:hypothetical protein MRX96_048844 [Rhipicephalus microplus]